MELTKEQVVKNIVDFMKQIGREYLVFQEFISKYTINQVKNQKVLKWLLVLAIMS